MSSDHLSSAVPAVRDQTGTLQNASLVNYGCNTEGPVYKGGLPISRKQSVNILHVFEIYRDHSVYGSSLLVMRMHLLHDRCIVDISFAYIIKKG